MQRLGLALASLVLASCAAAGPAREAVGGEVTRIVDGDTIHVTVGGVRVKVRLIGVDAPETNHPTIGRECFGANATRALSELIADRSVRLEHDRERTDRYGRTLAYVYRQPDGLFVNLELIRRGAAAAMLVEPNDRHARAFAAAERAARAANLGLWSACPV